MKILESLLCGLRAVCGTFPDAREGRKGNIPTADFGMSAFSLFFMQSGSFLSFQRHLEKGQGRSNAQTLFGIEHIPSDNYIRVALDEADPVLLQSCFETVEKLLAEDSGLRKSFQFLGDRMAIALDGTEYFCSNKIACPHCLTRKRNNGKSEAYHTMLSAVVVAPHSTKVLPLMPEFIARQDGAEKQDCERNAVKRWFSAHAARLKPLRPVYLGDDIFACQPVVEMLINQGDDFIFTCKEDSHKTLYDFMDGADKNKLEQKIRTRTKTDIFRYFWIENVPLRDSKDAINVTWVGFQILDDSGKIKTKMAWVTNLSVTKENIAEIVSYGRTRWKIENETFNVMKNHGYELEHNFGHGKKYLAMMFAALNLLAFSWHSILDVLEPPWQAAREASAKRSRFFASMVTLTTFVIFPNWLIFLDSLTNFTIPPPLAQPQN